MSLELFPAVCWCHRWPALTHFQDTVTSSPAHALFQEKSAGTTQKSEKSKKTRQKKKDEDDDSSDSSSVSLDMDNYDNEPDAPCFSHALLQKHSQ